MTIVMIIVKKSEIGIIWDSAFYIKQSKDYLCGKTTEKKEILESLFW